MSATREYFNKNRAKFRYKLEAGCANCESIATDLHHIIPISLGGTNKDTNIVPLCAECHGKIHSKDFTKSRELLLAGVERCKATGKTKTGNWFGRQEKKAEELPADFIKYYKRLTTKNSNGDLTTVEVAKLLGVSRATLYRWIKLYEENN